eukprot:scaffold19840_cov33-Phaeocystis_antarctica.AAC.1
MQRAASLQHASQQVGRRAWLTWTVAAAARRASDLDAARRALGGCFWRWAQRAEASHLAVAEAEAEAERLWRLQLEPSPLSPPNPSALVPRPSAFAPRPSPLAPRPSPLVPRPSALVPRPQWPLWRWLLATLGSDNKSAKQLAGLLVDPSKARNPNPNPHPLPHPHPNPNPYPNLDPSKAPLVLRLLEARKIEDVEEASEAIEVKEAKEAKQAKVAMAAMAAQGGTRGGKGAKERADL